MEKLLKDLEEKLRPKLAVQMEAGGYYDLP